MDEIRRGFHHELEEIRQEMINLAAGVVERIPRGTQALLDGDLEAAEYIIRSDAEFNDRCLAIEERCYRILALQQPMAIDLRRVMAAVRILAELERSADLVVNLCKAARRIYRTELPPRLRGLITRMSAEAQQEWRFVIDAYAEGDAPLASAIEDMDDLLDRSHAEFVEAIFETHKGQQLELSVAVQLALVARFYERIGDHAVNVAERVRFMVTGELEDTESIRRAGEPADVQSGSETEG
jgi:phosphate transport system protein